MELRDRIKSQRMARGITQTELGRRIGVTKSTINKYELGLLTNPPLEVILKMAEALDCSPALLLGFEEPTVLNDESTFDLMKSNIGKLTTMRRNDFFKLVRYLYPELFDES